jgi:hypothetical protein
VGGRETERVGGREGRKEGRREEEGVCNNNTCTIQQSQLHKNGEMLTHRATGSGANRLHKDDIGKPPPHAHCSLHRPQHPQPVCLSAPLVYVRCWRESRVRQTELALDRHGVTARDGCQLQQPVRWVRPLHHRLQIGHP